MRTWAGRVLGCLLLAGAATPGLAQEPDPKGIAFFEKNVRPLLIARCYACHSTGAKTLRGSLLLDSRPGWMRGGDSGPVIVPGNPGESPLIKAVRYAEDGAQMPPSDRLPPEEIAVLVRWVRMGAPDPREAEPADLSAATDPKSIDFAKAREHWAFQPIRNVTRPVVQNESWPKSPIDGFILAALERRGFSPAPPANRRTLIRRATYDLVGLPPTPEEVNAFVSDPSPRAFADLIDRLLASQAYGERWGRHWLDVARYGDSNGGDINRTFPNAFRFRNYVIEAFNRDVPFDQFVHEQLAGDLLPATDDQREHYARLTATGFLVLGTKILSEEDKTKMLVDITDEQIDTVGKAFMALTLGCARCHDHKFDPIPTSDYYALAGIFESTKTMLRPGQWNERILAPPEVVKSVLDYRKKIGDVSRRLRDRTATADEEFRADQRRKAGTYLTAASAILWPDGPSPSKESPPEAAELAKESRINEAVLKNWVNYLRATDKGPDTIWHAWMNLVEPADDRASSTSSGPQSASENAAIAALFADVAPTSREELAAHYQKLFDRAGAAWRERTPSREAGEADDRPKTLPDPALERFRVVLYGDEGPPLLPRRRERKGIYSEEAEADVKRLRDEKNKLEKSQPKPDMAMGVEDSKVVNVKIHLRGDYLKPGQEVPRRFLQVIAGEHQDPLPENQSGRRQLAEWLTEPDHPLTSRVIVNRIWRWHFGQGIVATPNNFGTRGKRPTHPDLLDYLARRFIEGGWSIKAIHRLILLSATYQMSSRYDPVAASADPENRYLWRAPRRRLEAEAIRDTLLTVAGRLDRTFGGAPVEVSAENASTKAIERVTAFYQASTRRSVYLPVLRTSVYSMLALLDFPDGAQPVGNRTRAIVPTQALLLMNSPFVIQQAEHMAARLLHRAALDEVARVRLAYQWTLCRQPTSEDLESSLAFLEAYDETFDVDAERRERRLKAWTGLCQSLFWSNEFIYIE